MDPISHPASTIALAVAGEASAASPERKNVAVTPFSLSTCKICLVAPLGPSSNVSATYFLLPLGATLARATTQSVAGTTSPRSCVLPDCSPTHTSERPWTPHVCTYSIAPVPSTLSLGSITVA